MTTHPPPPSHSPIRETHRSVESIKMALAACDDDDLPDNFETNVIKFQNNQPIGVGTFAEVYQAQYPGTEEIVAVKKVMQDRNFRNRELQIMKVLDHPNCVRMKQYFVSKDAGSRKTYLHIVMEFVPTTLAYVNKRYVRASQRVPLEQVRIYAYQLLRACAYIHSYGIVHRDLKPQNVLVNPQTGELKLCDFGSAKVILEGETSICYICSRYYRAPELVFGARHYGTQSDLWSIGCLIAELILGRPLFPGENNDDQMKRIVQLMGTPTSEDLRGMKAEYKCPYSNIPATPLQRLFPSGTDSVLIDLLSKLLVYSPKRRSTAIQALTHPFFDSLTDTLPSDSDPEKMKRRFTAPLFNFLPVEMETNGRVFQTIFSKHTSRFPQPALVGSPPPTTTPSPPHAAQKNPTPKISSSAPQPTVPTLSPVQAPAAKAKKLSLSISLPTEPAQGSTGTVYAPPNTAVAFRSTEGGPKSPFSRKPLPILSPAQPIQFTFPPVDTPHLSSAAKPRQPSPLAQPDSFDQ
ncbi:putative Glycogen synthase kinase-3 [Blattamonas nauphoetae]|uniref:Glycogen synthase kinase-3 n=1 Tax=Blattamonas nauphoetae TaxID=2049346 RepID=A0ABQ9XAG1_9EUKA|nr:putative Glycogen synthase kinase-3 [Blattamonas nauphoetae]